MTNSMKAETVFEFTEDWFSHNSETWRGLFAEHVERRPRILEIGSFEGRSAVWLITHIARFHQGGELVCIDTWEGSQEHKGKVDMAGVEERFRENTRKATSLYPSVQLQVFKLPSLIALSQLISSKQTSSFDFIYVDGAHGAPEILTDLVLSFQVCKVGGLIAVDDYLWKFSGNPLNTPKMATDYFSHAFGGKVEPIRYKPLYQFFFRKTEEIKPPPT